MTSTDPAAPPVTVVTGASSGIGAATVRRLAAEGHRVHAVARRGDRLEALAAATGCVTHVCDVTDTEALVALAAEIGTIDVLINNAGLGRMDAPLFAAPITDVTRTVETNITALMVFAVVKKALLSAKIGSTADMKKCPLALLRTPLLLR